jgi:hypothetical protein
MKRLNQILLVASAITLSSCATFHDNHKNHNDHEGIQHAHKNLAYHNAVVDASQAEQGENVDGLLSITAENELLIRNEHGAIKVTTWKSQSGFDKFIAPFTVTSDVAEYGLWVSLAPETKTFCSQYITNNSGASKKDLDLRLKQWLGLNEDWEYDVMVELWVQPEDLFRPCVDPQTNDSQCALNLPKGEAFVQGISDYPAFFNALYTRSFRTAPGVPWTGLGYTYDWNENSSKVGASEFITVPSSKYEVAGVVATWEYCQGE